MEDGTPESAASGELLGTGRYMSALELKAWTRFLDASRLIEQMLEQHLSSAHEMSHSEYEILVRLDGNGGSMRLAVLADQCVSSRSRLTHMLNRVEGRGWIRRDRVVSDGRGFNAVLTPVGADVLARAAQGHADLIRGSLLDAMDAEELKIVGEVFDRVSSAIREGCPEA